MSKPKHDLNELFLAVGQVTISWAFLEEAIMRCIDAIYEHWDGASIVPEYPEMSLKRKIRALRDFFAPGTELSKAYPDFLQFVDVIEQLGDQRHMLIHGIATELEAFHETGTAKVLRKRRKGRRTILHMADVNCEALSGMRDHIIKLATFLSATRDALKLHVTFEDDAD